MPLLAPAKRWLPLSRLLLLTGLTLLASAVIHTADLLHAVASKPTMALDASGPTTRAASDPNAPESLSSIEPAAGPQEPTSMAYPDGTMEGGETPWRVEALEAIAAELNRRQAALAAREQVATLREAAVKLAEERLRNDIAALEKSKSELELRIHTLSRRNADDIAQMIKVYEAMKAKNAAAIFETMEPEILVSIVRGMRDTKAAAIIAEMTPEKARKLTLELGTEPTTPGLCKGQP
ncbi:MotE family protein [Benzoatithermus flavus]|uniref:Magnesium transporter MgtE intracellular domain-containing protein n=1 Tax=Benzoatithermus flavus TaxID=3108223 RepID=A0ABU8XXL6_9PROT